MHWVCRTSDGALRNTLRKAGDGEVTTKQLPVPLAWLVAGMLLIAGSANMPWSRPSGDVTWVCYVRMALSWLALGAGSWFVTRYRVCQGVVSAAIPLASALFALAGVQGRLDPYVSAVCFTATYMVSMWVLAPRCAWVVNAAGIALTALTFTPWVPVNAEPVNAVSLLIALAVVAIGVRTARKHLQQAVAQAHHDYLTGVVNRRSLAEDAPAMVRAARDRKQQVAVLTIDIDYFKQVNDTFGHSTGDRVLRRLAKIIVAACRNDDVVARLGGDEFVVFAEVPNATHAAHLAERIRSSVAATEGTVPVTVSIGVATFDQLEPMHVMLVRSDAALYAAKNAGRDRVYVVDGHSDDPPEATGLADPGDPAEAPDDLVEAHVGADCDDLPAVNELRCCGDQLVSLPGDTDPVDERIELDQPTDAPRLA